MNDSSDDRSPRDPASRPGPIAGRIPPPLPRPSGRDGSARAPW